MSRRYLLDTNVISHIMQGRDNDLLNRLTSVAVDRVALLRNEVVAVYARLQRALVAVQGCGPGVLRIGRAAPSAVLPHHLQIAEVELLGHQRGGGSCTMETNGLLIPRQPQDEPVLLGSTATFRVRLSGPWKVQWFRNGVAIPGATDPTLTISNVQPANVGSYTVHVTYTLNDGTNGGLAANYSLAAENVTGAILPLPTTVIRFK